MRILNKEIENQNMINIILNTVFSVVLTIIVTLIIKDMTQADIFIIYLLFCNSFNISLILK